MIPKKMTLKKYNRNLEKKIGAEIIESHFCDSEEEVREKLSWDDEMEDYSILESEERRRKHEKIEMFVDDYLEKNNQEMCKKCFVEECFLKSSFRGNECDYTGLRVRKNDETEELEIINYNSEYQNNKELISHIIGIFG